MWFIAHRTYCRIITWRCIGKILYLFNDECFLFSGWSLMNKCFDVLISIMEKKGAEGYIQLIEGLDNIPKQGYKCGLCKIIKYSLQGTTQGRYLTGGVPPVRFSM